MSQSTTQAWEQFRLSNGVAAQGVREVIADSWVRSQRMGVEADRIEVPRVDVDTESELVSTATPVLVSMARTLAATPTSLALTDARGTVLWRWFSEPAIGRLLDATEFEAGSAMGEAVSGTNGIGVATTTGRPAAVIGSEHYKQAWHRWACFAAPVVHPVERTMVGVVNLASQAHEANPFMPVTVRSMVKDIQTLLLDHSTLPEQRLMAAHVHYRAMSAHPIITLNASTLIAEDRSLRHRLDHHSLWATLLELGQVRSVSIGELRARAHWLGDDLQHGVVLELIDVQSSSSVPDAAATRRELTRLEAAERQVIRDALVRNQGNKLAAATDLGISRGTLYARIRRYRLHLDP